LESSRVDQVLNHHHPCYSPSAKDHITLLLCFLPALRPAFFLPFLPLATQNTCLSPQIKAMPYGVSPLSPATCPLHYPSKLAFFHVKLAFQPFKRPAFLSCTVTSAHIIIHYCLYDRLLYDFFRLCLGKIAPAPNDA
jgi:hypothetical protein